MTAPMVIVPSWRSVRGSAAYSCVLVGRIDQHRAAEVAGVPDIGRIAHLLEPSMASAAFVRSDIKRRSFSASAA